MKINSEELGASLPGALRAEQHAQDLSLDDIARDSGVSYGSVRRYFAGDRSVPADALIKIAAAMGLSVEYIIDTARRRMEELGKNAERRTYMVDQE